MAEEASWIRNAREEERGGELREIYGRLAARRGSGLGLAGAAGLWPEFSEIRQAEFDLFSGPTELGADIKDLAAVLVSSLNNCRDCGDWYRQALVMRGWSDEKITHILQDIRGRHLAEPDRAVLIAVEKLTTRPQSVSARDIAGLRDAGLSDREILETVALTGYFNYVTRLSNALGVMEDKAD
jgi:uncharacterized peroxidase-related enzyme